MKKFRHAVDLTDTLNSLVEALGHLVTGAFEVARRNGESVPDRCEFKLSSFDCGNREGILVSLEWDDEGA